MELKNTLTVTRGEVGGGTQGKEGEGSSQGTCIKDPWTKMTGVVRIECGRRRVVREEESNGGNGDNYN